MTNKSSLWNRFSGNTNLRKNNGQYGTKSLQLEQLEQRQLLSVAPYKAPSETAPDTDDTVQPCVSTEDLTANVTIENADVAAVSGMLTPATAEYNATEVARLKNFFEQTDDEGIKNGTKLNSNYNANDVTTWTGVTWSGAETDRHVTNIGWSDKDLAGSLDVSYFTELTELYCWDTNLTSLNVAGCTELKWLSCDNNQLTELNITGCTRLEYLSCEGNQLTELAGTGNTSLMELYCQGNNITELDLTDCTALTNLCCNNNQLTELDVSNCAALAYMYCWNEGLTTVQLCNTAANRLNIYFNDETSWTVTDADDVETTVEKGEAYLCSTADSFTAVDEGEIQTIEFTKVNYDYYAADVTALRNFFAQTDSEGVTNGTKIFGEDYDANDPSSWNAIDWVCVDGKLRAYALYFDGCNLAGNANFSALTKLNSISIYNYIEDYIGAGLTGLNVSGCTELRYIFCDYNQITSIDVSKNTKLERLLCDYNKIKSLDVSKNTNLDALTCSGNQLTSIDVSKNTKLDRLYCDSNQLKSLDVTNNTELSELICSSNQLTELDLSKCTELHYLKCASNQFTSLDLSKNADIDFTCWSDTLKTIVLQDTGRISLTGSDAAWTFKDAEGNILDEDITFETEEDDYYEIIDIPLTAVNQTTGQEIEIVSVYDAYEVTLLRDFLEQCDDDDVSNGEKINSDFDYRDPSTWTGVTWSDSETGKHVTGINWSYKSLVGDLDVSDFTELSVLYCNNNQLTVMDVWGCSALEYLSCHNNQLSELDVSECASLKYLSCEENQLTLLNVAECDALEYLYCGNNLLKELDVSDRTALFRLSCSENLLTELDVSDCTALRNLFCKSNQLTELDVSANTKLTSLYCNENALTELDVSANTKLILLYCNGNALTELDVSSCPTLDTLDCWCDTLETVNLCNAAANHLRIGFTGSDCNWTITDNDGNETTVSSYSYYPTNSFPITAINEENTQTITFDKTVDYDYNEREVEALRTFLEQTDDEGIMNGEKLNEDYDADDPSTWKGVSWTLVDGELRVFEFSTYGAYLVGDADFSGMTSITNIGLGNEVFYEEFDEYGRITSLNVTGCTALQTISCEGNQITELIGLNSTVLEGLYCWDNQLTKLDVSGCTELCYLFCSNNLLTHLDVSNCKELEEFDCSNNQLTELDVTNNTKLDYFQCYNNQFEVLDLTKNTQLEDYVVYSDVLTTVYLPSEAIGMFVSMYNGDEEDETCWTFKDAAGNLLESEVPSYDDYIITTLPFTAENESTGQIILFTNAKVVSGNFDIDGNGVVDLLTDGLLVNRYLSEYTGESLTKLAIGEGATRTNADAITAYLDSIRSSLDIDGNGEVDLLTDGLLLNRYLSEYTGESLTKMAIGEGATRTTADEISEYIEAFVPTAQADAAIVSVPSHKVVTDSIFDDWADDDEDDWKLYV